MKLISYFIIIYVHIYLKSYSFKILHLYYSFSLKQLLVKLSRETFNRRRKFYKLRRKNGWSREKKRYHRKKEEGLARRFGEKGGRKLFQYETHRAAYRVKGANLKKPLPRLSAPRCGGIKIQKEEAPVEGGWNVVAAGKGRERYGCEKGDGRNAWDW